MNDASPPRPDDATLAQIAAADPSAPVASLAPEDDGPPRRERDERRVDCRP